jgi:transposase
MLRAYSADIRGRDFAAEHFEISASTAIKWVKCFRDTGGAPRRPRCASTSPLEEHADCLLTLIADQPRLTLDEVVSAMQKRGDCRQPQPDMAPLPAS